MIDLFLADIKDLTDEDYEKYFALMSDSRRNALLRMRVEENRKSTLLGEILARKAISAQTGMSIEEISIIRAENGKPYCENADIHFSISHSYGRVICAVSKENLGADIERLHFAEPHITRFCCIGSDFDYIFGEEDREAEEFTPEQLVRFYVLWTAKEAYCKYTAVGVTGMSHFTLAEIMPFCKIIKDNGFVTAIYSPSPDFEVTVTDLRRRK